jgi:hypothetical protein
MQWRDAFVTSVCVTIVLSLAPIAWADPSSSPPNEPVRVIWVRPKRVSASQRAALMRLLIAALEGRSMTFAARDSRPISRPLPPPGSPAPGSNHGARSRRR